MGSKAIPDWLVMARHAESDFSMQFLGGVLSWLQAGRATGSWVWPIVVDREQLEILIDGSLLA